ncbi:unnamed protein product [Schistocephalus solidus]|uniref:Uncharacterized protein n=1 Tax=Schistocephalus solidus TaxID=70667 RepID=A0A183TNH3_SCHSO|nr:unnamed protein product [Schistocephalus solidus]
MVDEEEGGGGVIFATPGSGAFPALENEVENRWFPQYGLHAILSSTLSLLSSQPRPSPATPDASAPARISGEGTGVPKRLYVQTEHARKDAGASLWSLHTVRVGTPFSAPSD